MRIILEKLHFAAYRRWLEYSSPRRAIILTLHRTTSGRVWEEQYNNRPEYLYRLFELMRQQGFNFYSMDEVMSHQPLKQPAVSVVSDDGFLDNLIETVPIFKDMNIPYCLYISAAVVLREDITLEAMAQYMMEHPEWKCRGVKRGETPETDAEAFEKAINTVRNAKTSQDIKKAKESFLEVNKTNLKEEMDFLYLNQEQVHKMTEDKLCTFGAHGYNHVQMRRLTERELDYNTKAAKSVLEQITGKTVKHFAYPFGGFCDNYTREFKAVKAAGYISGAMFWNGVVTEKFRAQGYMLPRIQVNPFKAPEENIEKYKEILKGI